jgi:hypothetical protein
MGQIDTVLRSRCKGYVFGLTDLGRRAGVPQSVLWGFVERGRDLRLSSAEKLLAYFGLSLDALNWEDQQAIRLAEESENRAPQKKAQPKRRSKKPKRPYSGPHGTMYDQPPPPRASRRKRSRIVARANEHFDMQKGGKA